MSISTETQEPDAKGGLEPPLKLISSPVEIAPFTFPPQSTSFKLNTLPIKSSSLAFV